MTPGPAVRRPRAGLQVQVGQTLVSVAVVMLLVGLLLGSGDLTVWIGLVLLVVGLPLLVVGLRRRRAGPG